MIMCGNSSVSLPEPKMLGRQQQCRCGPVGIGQPHARQRSRRVRGELVEIGGSFRIPDVIEQSGCTIREVGTTNKTHLSDYERAIGEDTGALMKVHTSNYRIIGFTESAAAADLVRLAHAQNLPCINDLGSGLFIDLESLGLPHEPTVREVIEAGCDVVTFSGDKLLGGPQAGIIVGKASYIERMRRHPLLRALRIDKMTLAGLEGTLRIYRDGEAVQKIPTLAALVQLLMSAINAGSCWQRL